MNKNLSEAVYTVGDHDRTLQNEYDDISMRAKLTLTRFGGNFGTLGFDEKSFFNTFLVFTPCWDYEPIKAIHADSPAVYTSEKILNLSAINKTHLKGDVIDGSLVKILGHPIPVRLFG